MAIAAGVVAGLLIGYTLGLVHWYAVQRRHRSNWRDSSVRHW